MSQSLRHPRPHTRTTARYPRVPRAVEHAAAPSPSASVAAEDAGDDLVDGGVGGGAHQHVPRRRLYLPWRGRETSGGLSRRRAGRRRAAGRPGRRRRGRRRRVRRRRRGRRAARPRVCRRARRCPRSCWSGAMATRRRGGRRPRGAAGGCAGRRGRGGRWRRAAARRRPPPAARARPSSRGGRRGFLRGVWEPLAHSGQGGRLSRGGGRGSAEDGLSLAGAGRALDERHACSERERETGHTGAASPDRDSCEAGQTHERRSSAGEGGADLISADLG